MTDINLSDLGLKFVGFWDSCFFVKNSKYHGLIVEDKDGNIKNLSYFELSEMMKGLNNARQAKI